MDAAIAEGAKDFRFVNNTEAPIYIEGYTYGGKIYFNLYGEEYRSADRKVTYESETLETIDPTTELTADPEKAFGSMEQIQSAHTGYKAKLWKIVTENGEQVSKEEVNNSYYQMTPNKYKVGVKTSNAGSVQRHVYSNCKQRSESGLCGTEPVWRLTDAEEKIMKIGKLPEPVLIRSVLKQVKHRREEVLVGPAVGQDCAALEVGEDEVLVMSTDPITGTAKDLGHHSIHITANDLGGRRCRSGGSDADCNAPGYR